MQVNIRVENVSYTVDIHDFDSPPTVIALPDGRILHQIHWTKDAPPRPASWSWVNQGKRELVARARKTGGPAEAEPWTFPPAPIARSAEEVEVMFDRADQKAKSGSGELQTQYADGVADALLWLQGDDYILKWG